MFPWKGHYNWMPLASGQSTDEEQEVLKYKLCYKIHVVMALYNIATEALWFLFVWNGLTHVTKHKIALFITPSHCFSSLHKLKVAYRWRKHTSAEAMRLSANSLTENCLEYLAAKWMYNQCTICSFIFAFAAQFSHQQYTSASQFSLRHPCWWRAGNRGRTATYVFYRSHHVVLQ